VSLLRRFFRRRDDRLSDRWLRDHQRSMTRIDFHSAPMQWPIKKLHNESPIWNRAKLRKVEAA
jgi:hypothetical protein